MNRDLELELSVAHNALREIGREDLIGDIKIMSYRGDTATYVLCRPAGHPDNKIMENALLLTHMVHDKTAHYTKCPRHPKLYNLHCDGCGLDGSICEEDIIDCVGLP